MLTLGCAFPELKVGADNTPSGSGSAGSKSGAGSGAQGGSSAGTDSDGAGGTIDGSAGEGGANDGPISSATAPDGTLIRVEGSEEDARVEVVTPGEEAVSVADLPLGAELLHVDFSPDGSKAGLWLRYRAPDVTGQPKTDDYWIIALDEPELLRKARHPDALLGIGASSLTNHLAELGIWAEGERALLLASLRDASTLIRWYPFDALLPETDVLARDTDWADWAITVDVPSEDETGDLITVRQLGTGSVILERSMLLSEALRARVGPEAGVIAFDAPGQSVPGAQSFVVLDSEGSLLLEGLPSPIVGRAIEVSHTASSAELTLEEWSGSAWSEEPTTLRYFYVPDHWQRIYGSFEDPEWTVGEAVAPATPRTLELRDAGGAKHLSRPLGDNVVGVEASTVDDHAITTITRNLANVGDHHDLWIVNGNGEVVVESVAPSLKLRVDEVVAPLTVNVTLWQAGQGFPDANARRWKPPFGELASGNWGIRQTGLLLGAPTTIGLTNGHGGSLGGHEALEIPAFEHIAPPTFAPNGEHGILYRPTPLGGVNPPKGGSGADIYLASASTGVTKLFSSGPFIAIDPNEATMTNDGVTLEPIGVVPHQVSPFFRALTTTSIRWDGFSSTADITGNLVTGNEGSTTVEDGSLYISPGGSGTQLAAKQGAIADLTWTPTARLSYRTSDDASLSIGLLDMYGQDMLVNPWTTVALPDTGGQPADVTVDLGALLADPQNTIVNAILISNTVGATQISSLVFESSAP